jgi:Ca-activated chloride channel family protein
MGNYRDDLMEQLADKGNGNYAYCDSVMQARRIFQEQLGSTLEMIAKDVKVQVDFDPSVVTKYRLIGYENRNIADRDFRNDKVDAGEMGSGHTVTALYELELASGGFGKIPATVRIRAKKPQGETADEWVVPFKPSAWSSTFADAPRDFRFSVAVMGAAEIFRGSAHAKNWSLGQVEKIARAATPEGNAERTEFLTLIERAQDLFGGVASK